MAGWLAQLTASVFNRVDSTPAVLLLCRSHCFFPSSGWDHRTHVGMAGLSWA